MHMFIYVLDRLIRPSQQADTTEYISSRAHLLICSSRCATVKKPVLFIWLQRLSDQPLRSFIRTDLSGGSDLQGPRKEDLRLGCFNRRV